MREVIQMDGDTGTEVRRVVIDDRPVAAMGEWISVKDRLPMPSRKVLVWVVGVYGVAYCDENGYWYDADDNESIQGVTHWMPLPDPPTETEV